MIDPDNIILAKKNEVSTITLPEIPIFDALVWDFDEPKELKKYFTTIEAEVRNSFEYREMIHFIKTYYDMDQCAFIKYDPMDTTNIRIEIHHSPFTLFDVVLIIYRKRNYYGEHMESHIVAKEITILHYKLLIGLIPLSKTVHQLVHSGKLFIPATNVFGDYRKFVDLYKPFCDEEQLETLDRIEKYSTETSELMNTSILDQNMITYNIANPEYRLPDFDRMGNQMKQRVIDIKQNGYRLPILDEVPQSDDVKDRQVIDPNKKGIEVLEFV